MWGFSGLGCRADSLAGTVESLGFRPALRSLGSRVLARNPLPILMQPLNRASINNNSASVYEVMVPHKDYLVFRGRGCDRWGEMPKFTPACGHF